MKGMPHLDAKGVVHAPHGEDEDVVGHLEAVLLQPSMLGECGRHHLGGGVDVSHCCLIVLALRISTGHVRHAAGFRDSEKPPGTAPLWVRVPG